jgi:hypothetical protein
VETGYSVTDLYKFLEQMEADGVMPGATAQAMTGACRSVFEFLAAGEGDDLRKLDAHRVFQRFVNKRGADFNPSSLKEYGRRVRRSIELFLSWREDPTDFSVETRVRTMARLAGRSHALSGNSYNSSIPVRQGVVVTLLNIPRDLTAVEAERLAIFVRMLAAPPPVAE